MDVGVFERHEAEVRSYCRSFPFVVETARNATLRTSNGESYIDFLAGAGTLNYGHNPPDIKAAVLSYLQQDGIVHSLDMYTVAKSHFIETFHDVILEPRGLDYKMTFPGPTGTNAVETALKIARLATGRSNVIAFSNAFHGMTLGSLAASANATKREGAGIPLNGVTRMPYDGYAGNTDTADQLDAALSDGGSGIEPPAAILVETVQGEGGLNAASPEWLRAVSNIAKRHGALLIVDDIQTGCGRTGTFFSFEGMGFTPDIVCLSKAIGGMGLPMSLVLFRPDLDVLKPGQHNGTFRGHNLAFVAATAALDYWREDREFEAAITTKSALIRVTLDRIVDRFPGNGAHVRGRGLMLGIGWSDPEIAGRVSQAAYAEKVVMETTGFEDQVLKLIPPLTISDLELARGLRGLEKAAETVLAPATEEAPIEALN